jgi:hypothetical protein
MIRRVGWTTATILSKGNHSSRCTYKRGARACARTDPLSVASSAPATVTGRGGMCARGPHAVRSAKASPAAPCELRDKMIALIVLEN